MELDIDNVLQQIVKHPYIEKSKTVREISGGHSEASVYIHLKNTLDEAKDALHGGFVTNPQAKQLFMDFMDREIDGVPYKDIAQITALIHDIGKILSYKENDEILPLNMQKPNAPVGNTYSPGHEYWGSTLVPDILKETGLSPKTIDYVSAVVRLHGAVYNQYDKIKTYTTEEAVNEVKSRVEGYHIEVLFNAYCDLKYNKKFVDCREFIVTLLHFPALYIKRAYFVS